MSDHEGPAIARSDDTLEDAGTPSPAEEDAARAEEGHHDPASSEDTTSGGSAD
ncbi:hypothetical protein [Pseudolysinimonas sp.]|uniref:hypothetical protein n=1 Tax=Pseudolysinimonas sp. TaxID=2680009 RepID=UPI003F7F0430